MELLIIFSSLFIASLIALISKRRALIETVSVIASLVVFGASTVIASKVVSAGEYLPNVYFSVDSLGALLLLIISCVGLAVTIYSIAYLRKESAKGIVGLTRIRQYFALLNLFVAVMVLAVSSSSPILAWISIEATTLSTAFLISFYNKPSAMEAAWKYLIINSIGLLLAFFGTLLYFTSLQTVGETGFTTWGNLLSNATYLDPAVAKIVFIFVLIGYGTKVGLVPMHTWLPDAHSKAPAPISALLSGVLLNVAFIIVLRFKAITDLAIGPDFSQKLLIIFGLFSVLVAALIIFTQKNYKRLLAYSSIENMGITALGFGFGGVGIFAAVLHLIYHSLVKSALFLTAGNIFLKYGSTKIAKIRGAIGVIPVTAILFLVGFFAITGAPPFGIFLTKLLIFSAGITLHPVITILMILLTALVFVGFFRHAQAMVFGKAEGEIKKESESFWLILPPLSLLVLAFYFSVYQPPFLQILIDNVISHY
jgi:hydrogenase-4 component F